MEFLHVHGTPHKKWKLKESTRTGSFQTKKWSIVKKWQDRGVWACLANGKHVMGREEFYRVCVCTFLALNSIAIDKNVFLLLVQGRHSSHREIPDDPFQGRREKRKGQRVPPASVFFSDSLSLRCSAFPRSLFWGCVPWTPSEANQQLQTWKTQPFQPLFRWELIKEQTNHDTMAWRKHMRINFL